MPSIGGQMQKSVSLLESMQHTHLTKTLEHKSRVDANFLCDGGHQRSSRRLLSSLWRRFVAAMGSRLSNWRQEAASSKRRTCAVGESRRNAAAAALIDRDAACTSFGFLRVLKLIPLL